MKRAARTWGKRRACRAAHQEARRLEIARLLMERKNYREILGALKALPEGRRPKNVSLGTVARDVAALRAEWARERAQVMDELVGEEVARLNRLEQSWWERGLAPHGAATDKGLAIRGLRA